MTEREDLKLELRYPHRYRCANCRKPFRGKVIDGLWCGPECVIVPEVSENPDDWPREHYAPPLFEQPKRAKRAFPSRASAQAAMNLWRKNHGTTFEEKHVYCCTYCFQWHVGKLGKERG